MNIEYIAEIQTRTLFEEAWSEIDHRFQYPNHTKNLLTSEYLNMFNIFAGCADHMGSFMKKLNEQITIIQDAHKQEVENKNKITKEFEDQRKKMISELESLKTDKKNDAKNIKKLQDMIESLEKESYRNLFNDMSKPKISIGNEQADFSVLAGSTNDYLTFSNTLTDTLQSSLFTANNFCKKCGGIIFATLGLNDGLCERCKMYKLA